MFDDVALFETVTNELWIEEVKSGNIQKIEKMYCLLLSG